MRQTIRDHSPFSEYLTWPKSKLLARYAEVCEHLCNLYPEVGLTRAQELKERKEVWISSRQQSVTGRTEEARYAGSVATASLYELEGMELSLKEEKFFLLELLTHAEV